MRSMIAPYERVARTQDRGHRARLCRPAGGGRLRPRRRAGRSASTSIRAAIGELRAGHDRTREVEPRGPAAIRRCVHQRDPATLAARRFLHRHRADADRRRRAGPISAALRQASRDRRQGAARRATSSSTNRPSIPAPPRRICVPVLEQASGLKAGQRLHRRLFARAHQSRRQASTASRPSSRSSPARTRETLDVVADVYGSVVTAGVHARPRSRSPRPPR